MKLVITFYPRDDQTSVSSLCELEVEVGQRRIWQIHISRVEESHQAAADYVKWTFGVDGVRHAKQGSTGFW